MATLRDIQRRIRSVQSTQKITKAMKLVAASKFRRAHERIGSYLAEEVDEVHLMYNEFRSVAVQRPVREQLLPIEAEGAADGDAGPQEEYLYEPGPEAILASLLPRHVTTQVYRALMESAAGEYGARMTAMEAASKNAREMINLLTSQYKKARQGRITTQLLAIGCGASARLLSLEW